jgi:hypothetical protein
MESKNKVYKKDELNSSNFLKSESFTENNKKDNDKLNEIVVSYLEIRNKFNELWKKIL